MNRTVRSLLDMYQVRTRLQVYGSVPVPLYKAFDKLEYAEEFCRGKVRFQAIENYKRIEDATRSDASEGMGMVQYPGESLVVDLGKKTMRSVPGDEELHVTTLPDNNFVYCLSLPHGGSHDKNIEKFGGYIVRIGCPINFLISLSEAIVSDERLAINPPSLQASRVVYSKGTKISSKLNRSKAQRIAWAQKPASFSVEREYRLHFNASPPLKLSEDGVYYIDMKKDIFCCDIISDGCHNKSVRAPSA